MLLTSVETKNYRSLEHVTIKALSHFNVFIGRNNAGKSTVLGALQYLNDTVFRRIGSYGRHDELSTLTANDDSRVLYFRLTFLPTAEERLQFINKMISAGYPEGRGEQLRNSPFLRQVAYEFEAPPGNPWQLHITNVAAWSEDDKWAYVLKPGGLGSSHLIPQIFDQSAILSLHALTRDVMEGRSPIQARRNINIDLSTADFPKDVRELDYWLIPQLVEYFENAFFFSSFRHTKGRHFANTEKRLASDGENLPVVLNYLSGRNRSAFEQVEEFVAQAIPSIGLLHPGLVENHSEGTQGPQEIEVTVQTDGGYDVPLANMGGGVEQLLMVATTLATVEEAASLFLEEPELHLHPGAQRYLIERLQSGTRQVFLTTHSPVFINITPPRSLYQVRAEGGRSIVGSLSADSDMAMLLDDIGARNSDILLSDAVIFVEGPSDRDILLRWAEILGSSLDEQNIAVLAMGGGRSAARHAPARSDVLAGISRKSPVPHWFVLDRDERSHTEILNLKQQLGDRLHLLERREIENYLLLPRAISTCLEIKYAESPTVLEQLKETTTEQIEILIDQATQNLYGHVLLKRIGVELKGLPQGFLPSEVMAELVPFARESDLPKQLSGEIKKRLNRAFDDLDIDGIVQSERSALDTVWADPKQRLAQAPGAEVLEYVFRQLGGDFEKRKDAPRLAAEMTPDEIAPEIAQFIHVVMTSLDE